MRTVCVEEHLYYDTKEKSHIGEAILLQRKEGDVKTPALAVRCIDTPCTRCLFADLPKAAYCSCVLFDDDVRLAAVPIEEVVE